MFYAVGDIHGEISLLRELYQKILDDIASSEDDMNTIVFLGDYIDRGEDSKAVLDFLMSLTNTDTLKHVFLTGNHEELMIHSVEHTDFAACQMWLQNGGLKTLEDFGITLEDAVNGALDKYIDWIKRVCFLYLDTPSYVFCHGGVDTKAKLKETRPEVFTWKRTHYTGSYMDYPKIVVHGHTPLEDGIMLQGFNEINVDTGSYFTKVITAAVLPNEVDVSTVDFSFSCINTLRPKIYS